METISLKVEQNFLRDMKKSMKHHRYATTTEFVRDAVRDKMLSLEKQQALLRLDNIYGMSKRKTTDEQLHAAGEKAVKLIARRLGVSL